MNPSEPTRREALRIAAITGLAAMAPAEANAQGRVNVALADFKPRSAGSEHSARMQQAREALKGHSPLSQEGLVYPSGLRPPSFDHAKR